MPHRNIALEAARLVFANAWSWLAAGALFIVPVALAGSLSQALAVPAFWATGDRGTQYVIRAIEVLAQVVTEGVLVMFVLRARVGRPPAWNVTWNMGLGRIRSALTASLACLLPMAGYMIVLVLVPITAATVLSRSRPWYPSGLELGGGVYIAAVMAFFSLLLVFLIPVAMLERVGGLAGYRRARALLTGNWKAAAAALLPIVLTGQLLTAATLRLLPAPWDQLGRQIIDALLLPFEASASVLLYLRVRAAQESRDADTLAQQLWAPPDQRRDGQLPLALT